VAVVTSADTLYIHADYRNTPRQIDSSSQQAVWAWDPQAYGDGQPNQNPSGTQGSKFVYNLRFPGQYYDEETGNFYNYFRDYSPVLGRYLESDPLGLGAGLNTYAYVGGNPATMVDPFGLYKYTPTAGAPVDGATSVVLMCMDSCVGARHPDVPLYDLTVTGATEGGHTPGSAHETGQACDVGKKSNPGLSRQDVKTCYSNCAPTDTTYGQEEGNHFHIQTRPGVGGARGFADGVH
jgi:RHS repeat-associated protein